MGILLLFYLFIIIFFHLKFVITTLLITYYVKKKLWPLRFENCTLSNCDFDIKTINLSALVSNSHLNYQTDKYCTVFKFITGTSKASLTGVT